MRRAPIVGLALVAALAAGVAATWAPDRPVESLVPRWAPPPSRFVTVGALSAHVRDEGPPADRLPIVLLHGTSASLHTWEGWARVLREQRRVITVDLPGHGLTGPFAEGPYSMERYVRFVRELLDALAVDRCILGGSSFGGNIAWETAALHPERVARLILVDASGYPLEPKSIPIGFQLARMPGLRLGLEWILPRSVIESSVRNVYGDPTRVTPELVDRYYELTLRAGNRRALGHRLEDAPSGEHADRVPTLRVPTLILWGSEDRLVPPDHAERFHREIPGSTRVVFEGLGHVPHEEDPETTVKSVLAFVATATNAP